MADTLTTKKVTELTENTAMSDDDLFMVGSAGTASLRRLKWSNIWNTIKTAILGKLVANNLTTTAAGYLLDARQGKALDDKISKLNTEKTVAITKNTSKASFLLCDARKYGKMVTVSAKFTLNTALSSGYVIIANVSDQENFSAVQVNAYGNREDSGNVPFRVVTDSDGNIAIQYLGTTLPIGIMYCFSITWITN